VTRCAHCPVAEGSPCLGETAPELFPDFCRMAESGNTIQRKHIVGRSAIGLTSPQFSPEEQARVHRAAKPRIPLGTKHPKAKDG
jgi:hypothetical protein